MNIKLIKIAFLPFLLPLFLFGAGAEININNTDIIERTINFAIFVAILWYLLANKIKLALKDRQNKIAEQLDAVQNKLSKSRRKKEEALKDLEKSKQIADDIILNAKKESEIIVKNIENQCKNDIEIIKKNHKELLIFEQKKAKKAVINEILDELLIKNDIDLEKKDYINIITKKVA
ncbi:F0F1 ATP synthase subunit B [Helicobacter sp. MIT 14-3879]|uniref:F0F1 ATP synthase subunit B n=1 Tax=Helicobacter sp. MIT 14-3879 TaxID=2040649 RepID=UPI000E1E4502|nr:F0F1 ATP synthase subunit B [Helicobacter sp. MIT 14-3879]RDU63163.1 F0F1 ATP synthase subunit B [Helicobacter sp. MIT 14-3879]